MGARLVYVCRSPQTNDFDAGHFSILEEPLFKITALSVFAALAAFACVGDGSRTVVFVYANDQSIGRVTFGPKETRVAAPARLRRHGDSCVISADWKENRVRIMCGEETIPGSLVTIDPKRPDYRGILFDGDPERDSDLKVIREWLKEEPYPKDCLH